ncbi:Histidine phosphatase superfamily (branch 1) [Plasmodiophora brassicae]
MPVAYGDDPYAGLRCWSESDAAFVAHLEVQGSVFAVVHDADNAVISVELADLCDMRTTINRPYTMDEEIGLATASAIVRHALQRRLSTSAQVTLPKNDDEHAKLVAHVTPATSLKASDLRDALDVVAPTYIPEPSLVRRPFYFLRHGQTDYNEEGRLQGHIESKLTDLGIAQAKQAATRLVELAPGLVWLASSTLKRAWRTAEIVHDAYRFRSVTFEDGLREQKLGRLEGRLRSEISKQDYDILKGFTTATQQHVEDAGSAESFPRFRNRIRYTLNKILEAGRGQPGLVVSHGGVFRTLLRLANQDRIVESDNCAIWRFDPPSDPAMPWTVQRVP